MTAKNITFCFLHNSKELYEIRIYYLVLLLIPTSNNLGL